MPDIVLATISGVSLLGWVSEHCRAEKYKQLSSMCRTVHVPPELKKIELVQSIPPTAIIFEHEGKLEEQIEPENPTPSRRI
jgi:hypothetical protein